MAARRRKAARVDASGVSLCTEQGDEVEVGGGSELERVAMRWSYVARYRRRWTGQAAERRLALEIAADLRKLGVTARQVKRLAEASVVEVRVPYASEELGWAGRVLPWEFALSAVTRAHRQASLMVVRHLRLAGRRGRRAEKPPQRAVIVEIVPAGLRDGYDFSNERRLVEAGLRMAPELVADPTFEELSGLVASRPDLIHVSGVDNHQAAELLGLGRTGSERIRDGLPLRLQADSKPDFVEALRLSQALAGAGAEPRLVAFNVYNSAPRLAALQVAAGASAAIGFQDSFDDGLAELFYAHLYRAWRVSGWDLLVAFREAWRGLEEYRQSLRGTGIVLWSARSLLAARAEPLADSVRAARELTVGEIHSVAPQAEFSAEDLRSWLSVKVAPVERLNYSLLHNDRDLFTSFEILNTRGSPIRGVEVSVELCVGADTFPWRAVVDLPPLVTTLKERVRVPLLSSAIRATQEEVYTTLFVELKLAEHVLYRDTHRVSLLPVDEWRDNREDAAWLPSFVLPRDRAVERVVRGAGGFLRVLRDEPAAGFDGYQAIGDGELGVLDGQVQALWWALLELSPLAYINPPPSYTERGQRVRTPSVVLDGGRGTCLDLALLFAACLEHVDIYPVIFLFARHATVGYWRSLRRWQNFQGMGDASPASPGAAGGGERERTVARSAVQEPYMAMSDAFAELASEVQAGNLVPLETVCLTARGSFEQAQTEGKRRLAEADFVAMIDIVRARRDPRRSITPLPL